MLSKSLERWKFCHHCKHKQYVFNQPSLRLNFCEKCKEGAVFDKWSDVPPRGVPPTPTSATPLPLAHLFDYRLRVILLPSKKAST